MKGVILALCAVLSVCAAIAQPYAVGRRTITFTDEQRNNRSISTELYYPASTNGNNVPVAGGTEKFPVVVFGHGFLIPTSAYTWLGDSLARQGFIVAMPNTEGSFLPSHGNFGSDLSVVATKLVLADNDPASPFYQRVMNKAAVGGHSMGGGASFLAAGSGNTNIRALFNFAAAETNPSATTAALSVNMPSIIFSGSRDCIVPPATQLSMYNNIPSSNCKVYINITDGLHCHFANNNFTCATGQALTGCNSSPLSAPQIYAKTISLLIPFLNYHLKEICLQGEVFQLNYNTITGVIKQIQCPPLPSCGVVPVRLLLFNGQYAGKKNVLNWKSAQEINSLHFELEKSNDGRNFVKINTIASAGSETSGASYTVTDEFPYAGSNFYRLKMVDTDYSYDYSEIINVRTPLKDIAVTGIFPNPLKEVLRIEVQSAQPSMVRCEVWDVSGRMVQCGNIQTVSGISTATLSMASNASGVYWLKVFTAEGQRVGQYKLIKY